MAKCGRLAASLKEFEKVAKQQAKMLQGMKESMQKFQGDKLGGSHRLSGKELRQGSKRCRKAVPKG